MSIGKNIAAFRRKKGWTQAQLGDIIGVSNQAVSKWESEMTMPDVMLLPDLADAFGCYIDELFSREVKTEIHYDHCAELPWNDDETIRGVVCKGKKILKVSDLADRFTFEITGEAKNVQSECNIEIKGNVSGGCKAGLNISVDGGVSGGCHSGGDITVQGGLSGGCNTGGDVTVGGGLSGGCNIGGDICCAGDLSGDINCGGEITVRGDVEAVRIKGNVICNSLKCDKVEGDITINSVD